MPPARATLRSALKSFDFATIFNQLGWDNHIAADLHVAVDSSSYRLRPVAQKRGMVIYLHEAPDSGELPTYAVRRKIENQVRRSAHEHLVIYASRQEGRQVWQWVRRELGTPTACREHSYSISQQGDALIEKLERIAFSLAEEDSLSITMVAGRARDAFDVERVTKRFYDRFKREHDSFLSFITGVKAQGDREWYASLMLNRLMFVYFIQKKGFLDGDPDYLRHRLVMMQTTRGKNQFLSFYRHFALRLFHEGLGAGHHDAELDVLLGRVPYINGGLFDFHKLERDNPDIEIPDEAFEKIFDFFDAYQWHLDERPLRDDNEINPDVLGYIFEKYINQKQMGAYYTKEDITEYIAKNSVIPFVLKTARDNCGVAFEKGSALWRLLRADPGRYIYEGMTLGNDKPLPDEIEAGLAKLSARSTWNTPASAEVGLPTETWREVVARRLRARDIATELSSGNVQDADRLVTLNVNVRQFCQDIIENSEGPELVRALYQAIEQISILDPTCGSGAFLFAALNVLEPLYEACLDRMQSFVDESAVTDARRGDHFADFKTILHRVAEHPNRRYFILKSIILNNLYGVDIMDEAVEICKLRLFLKLVAQVEEVAAIEPLPDIDFNIRAGNSLVGFVNHSNVEAAVLGATQGRLDLGDDMTLIDAGAAEAEKAFDHFRHVQTAGATTSTELGKAKQEVQGKLQILREELDRYLASQHGVSTNNQAKLEAWKATYQPFHWWVEFYGIVQSGGFDVVIGNPPYVEYSERTCSYRVDEELFRTYPSRNLYAFVFERAKQLTRDCGRVGLIVQISAVSTPAMESMVAEIRRDMAMTWLSNYATRPVCLFEGVTMNLTIILSEVNRGVPSGGELFSTKYLRWVPDYRPYLFQTLAFVPVDPSTLIFDFAIPKLTEPGENQLLRKLMSETHRLRDYLDPSGRTTTQEMFYRTAGGRYYKIFLDRPFGSESKSNKSKSFAPKYDRHVMISVLSSDLWWWYYTLHFDMYNCKDYMMYGFPFDYARCPCVLELKKLGKQLAQDLFEKAERKLQTYATTGAREQLIFRPSLSRQIIEQIDDALAEHYSLTPGETAFIRNYDIKYRLGAADDEDAT